MKKLCVGVLAVVACVGSGLARDFYVATNGSDKGNGSAEKPYASLQQAIWVARTTEKGPHQIIVKPGNYFLEKMIALDQRDSNLTIKAEKPGTAVFYGGVRVSGWKRDGDHFWSVDLPGVKEGEWDFRALLVDGRLAERACYPGDGKRLENLGKWNVRLLPAIAGWWERKPTREELSTMPYKPEDIPPNFSCKNAELRLYHMWSESLVGVASNNVQTHTLYFNQPADWPAGACNRRQYVIFNTREGMTKPGQWYLDRDRGKLVYWPLPTEKIENLFVVVPKMKTILMVYRKGNQMVDHLTVSGLAFCGTTPPQQSAGFGGGNLAGAVNVCGAKNTLLKGLEISHVGGSGMKIDRFYSSVIRNCNIHDIGSRGLGLYGANSTIEGSRVVRVGLLYPSSSAMGFGGEKISVLRNEIADVPYSGMIAGGSDILIEENLIERVMQVLHDGAAIYGSMYRATIRGNVVRDVVPVGSGFGASAYYLDERATDCIVEKNYAEGVPRPIHNHITRNTIVRDNVFSSSGDMTISFQNSVNCQFTGNTLCFHGKLNVSFPSAVKVWEGNRVYQPKDPKKKELGFKIGNAKPVLPNLGLCKEQLIARKVTTPPVLDGAAGNKEWPGLWHKLRRDEQNVPIGGAPSFVRVTSDQKNLYVAVQETFFRRAKISNDGAVWGKHDAMEVNLNGKKFRGYANGTLEAVDPAQQGKFKGYAGKAKEYRGNGKLIVYEFAIPFELIGITPKKGVKVPFNVRTFYAEYQEFRYWTGSAENEALGTVVLD